MFLTKRFSVTLNLLQNSPLWNIGTSEASITLLSFILNQKYSLHRSLTFTLIPNTPASLFSTLCIDHSSPPSPSHDSPPVPKKVPFTVSAHGRTWQYPYRWMSNTDDPDLSDHLAQENSYADAFRADTHTLQRTFLSEMTSRMPPKISTPPEPWGPWLYYQYIPEGKEYPVLCRRLKRGKNGWINSFLHYARGGFGNEEVLLDWNEIAKKYGYVHVGTCRISPDHHFLAYTLDIKGNEQFILQIKDLRCRCIISKVQINGVVSLAEAEDSNTLFYTLSDENQRPHRVLCSKPGSDDTDDITVFTESDSNFCVGIKSTKDGKFITINSNSRTSSEEGIFLVQLLFPVQWSVCSLLKRLIYRFVLIESANPLGGSHKVWKRVPGVQYFLEHHHGTFYVLTNAPLHKSKEWSEYHPSN